MVQVEETQDVGLDFLIAGLGFQVLSLVLFAVACADFAWRVRSGKAPKDPKFDELRSSHRWTGFLVGECLIPSCPVLRAPGPWPDCHVLAGPSPIVIEVYADNLPH